jgi:hypothetical protein
MRALTLVLLLLLPCCLATAQHHQQQQQQHQQRRASSRRLLIRPMPGTAIGLTCRNTLLGPYDYTDDRGLMCKADDLDYQTGCCRKGDKHSCAT